MVRGDGRGVGRGDGREVGMRQHVASLSSALVRGWDEGCGCLYLAGDSVFQDISAVFVVRRSSSSFIYKWLYLEEEVVWLYLEEEVVWLYLALSRYFVEVLTLGYMHA
jgi:hypothetical protein